jgi:hypothetical protein
MNTTQFRDCLTKTESFGILPVVIHDGEHFHEIGRVSVVEIPKMDGMNCLVLRVGDPKEMSSFGSELREGKNDDWLQVHSDESQVDGMPPEPIKAAPKNIMVREGSEGKVVPRV